MIFYFSGTGNSRFIAKCISEHFGDTLIEINADLNSSDLIFDLKQDERIGIISPVYCYGLPTEVIKFAKKVKFNNYGSQYLYCFATYGGSAGKFSEELEKILSERGYRLSSKYGVTMADNYILSYDSPAEKRDRLNNEAYSRLLQLLSKIEAREECDDIKRGAMGFLAPIIRPFYLKGNLHKKFYVTTSCTSCGLCARSCPCNALKMVEGKPQWNDNCAQCLRCIHSCPSRAIQYGNGTKKRSRYLFDEKKINKI